MDARQKVSKHGLPFLRIDRFGNELTRGAIEAKITIREYHWETKGFRDSLVVESVIG